MWPASPCFNHLVYFDPMKPAEAMDTIVGELDPKKRLAVVHEIQKMLTAAGARPTVAWASTTSPSGRT